MTKSHTTPLNSRILLLYPLLGAGCTCGVLLQSSQFINAFYAPLFAVALAGCAAMLLAGHSLFTRKPGGLTAASGILLLPLWAVYISLHNAVSAAATLASFYMVVSLLTCLSLVCLLQHQRLHSRHLLQWVVAVAALQTVICLIQAAGYINAGEPVKAAGTWINPNIAAMYIALALPVVGYRLLTGGRHSVLWITLLLLLCVALLLLQCRTAIAAALLSAALLLNWRYGLLPRFIQGTSTPVKTILAAVALLIICFAGRWAWQLKQTSADSRVLIWKLTAQMAAQQPLTGYGYGAFERSYNLTQAAYFAGNTATQAEQRNAAHTKIAYNEFLQHAAEGGLPGLLFLTLFIGLLLRRAWQYLKTQHWLYYQPGVEPPEATASTVIATAGIIACTAMSLVNFTIQSIPVMSVVVVYAAILFCNDTTVGKAMPTGSYLRKAAATGLLITGCWLGMKTVQLLRQHYTIGRVVQLAIKQQYTTALQTLQHLPAKAQQGEDYWRTTANLHYFSGNKAAAGAAYQQALQYTSAPEMYQQAGNCLLAQQQYSRAAAAYQTALHIQPNRFTPRYLLLCLYIQQQDSSKALRLAQDILQLEEKIPSEQTALYKRTAAEIIHQLNPKK